jgi:hypothetical protein
MMSRLSRHELRGWTLFLALLLVTAGAGVWVGLAVGLAALAAVSSVITVPLAVAQAWLGWLMLQRTPEQASGFADGETADTGIALERLADAVKHEWADEESRRRLADPNPLPVSWSTVGPPVADHWENVRRDGSPEPLNLDGTLTAAKEGSSELLALLASQDTRGRIVLLGEPGSGKTVLLLRVPLQN